MTKKMTEKLDMKNDKESRDFKMNSGDFILLVLSCLAAPLISRICDLVIGPKNNELSGEKLLCVYFLIISIDCIYNYLLSAIKRTAIWRKCLRYGDADAVRAVLCIVGASIVVGCYDTLPGMGIIAALLVTVFVLITKSPDIFQINAKTLMSYVLLSALIIPIVMLDVFGYCWRESPVSVLVLLANTVMTYLVFSGMVFLAKTILRSYEERPAK